MAVLTRRHLSLGIDITGKDCLVVGGGRIGGRKALTLAEAGAGVTVLSPEICPRLQEAVQRKKLLWIAEGYSKEQIDGRFLVVAATDDPGLNLTIGGDCEARGILCCVVSPGRSSRVIFPAVYRNERLTVAVHSDGRDCAASRDIRDMIADSLRHGGVRESRLCVFGLIRKDVDEDLFAALCSLAKKAPVPLPSGGGLDELMILSTCWRWECWFFSDSPEAGARELRRIIHASSGKLPEYCHEALYLRRGDKALLHILEVACGLRSPLVGEKEILAQIRAARDSFLPDGDSKLRGVVDSVLGLQKSVRRESGLKAASGGWAERSADLLCASLPPGIKAKIAVVGLGALGSAALKRLRAKKMRVTAFSSRSSGSEESDARPISELADFVRSADLALLSSSEGPGAKILRAEALRRKDFRLLELSSSRDLSLTAGAGLTREVAARAAHAAKLAFEQVLLRAPRSMIQGRLRLGSRGSRLALAQVQEALRFLARVFPNTKAEVIPMDTPGDRDLKTPLSLAAEDFFTRDLDSALLDGRIEIAVHSAKDLPSRLPSGLIVAALLPAFAPWECMLSNKAPSLSQLSAGARIGISSERRRDWLAKTRPDLKACDIRGGVPERLAQLDAGKYDALFLASAGLMRLGLADRMTQVFSVEEFEPAAGQGSLAIVSRSEDSQLRASLSALDFGDREKMPWA